LKVGLHNVGFCHVFIVGYCWPSIHSCKRTSFWSANPAGADIYFWSPI